MHYNRSTLRRSWPTLSIVLYSTVHRLLSRFPPSFWWGEYRTVRWTLRSLHLVPLVGLMTALSVVAIHSLLPCRTTDRLVCSTKVPSTSQQQQQQQQPHRQRPCLPSTPIQRPTRRRWLPATTRTPDEKNGCPCTNSPPLPFPPSNVRRVMMMTTTTTTMMMMMESCRPRPEPSDPVRSRPLVWTSCGGWTNNNNNKRQPPHSRRPPQPKPSKPATVCQWHRGVATVSPSCPTVRTC